MKRLLLIVVIWIGLVVPCSAQEWHPTIVHLAIGAGVIAHASDLATTSWALGKAGEQYQESNPLLRWASNDPVKLAVAKMTVATAISYTMFRLHRTRPKLALGVAIAQTVLVGYVAHRNAQLLGLRQGTK